MASLHFFSVRWLTSSEFTHELNESNWVNVVPNQDCDDPVLPNSIKVHKFLMPVRSA